MSRGWENKSVQGMMDDHDNRPKHREPEKSAAQLAWEKKKYGLELSRKGVANDLERASHPRQRAQLEAALQHLDEQLGALELLAPDQQTGTAKGDAE